MNFNKLENLENRETQLKEILKHGKYHSCSLSLGRLVHLRDNWWKTLKCDTCRILFSICLEIFRSFREHQLEREAKEEMVLVRGVLNNPCKV